MSARASIRVDDRRAEIIAAGVRVLRREGFEKMRLRDVASEAGVSIGLIQHYFQTRKQIGQEAFAAACGERAREFAESAPTDGPAWTRIRTMLEYALDGDAIRGRAATWVDLCSAAGRDPELREEAARVQDLWRAPLSAAIAEGEASGELVLRLNRESTVETILALVDGAEVAAAIAGDDFQAETLHGATLHVVHELLGMPA